MKQRNSLAAIALVTLLALLAAAGLFLTWQRPSTSSPPAAPVRAARAAASAASAPQMRHPVEWVAAAAPASATVAPASLQDRLIPLFGREDVLSRLRLDDFARRIVATVDNLAREQAAARLWPVGPAGGRLRVQRLRGQVVISDANSPRYAPYIVLLERVDLQRLAALYKGLYPALQQAYEQLGYPHAYFNDRVVAVIDHLLAAPEPEGPVRVHRVKTLGAVPPQVSRVLYRFDDPALEARSAGHKIMLRMGPSNERRVKDRLRKLKSLLAPAVAASHTAP